MTDERNPQDHARELAEKIFKLLEREDDDQVFSEDLFIDQAIPLIVAHTASQLAGAVPQEELLELIAKWREMAKGNAYFWLYMDRAEELESLIERRGNGGSTQHR